MRTLLATTLLLTAAAALADSDVKHSFTASAARAQVRTVVVDIPAGEIAIRNGAADRLTISGYASRDPDGPRSRATQQRIVDDVSAGIVIVGDKAEIRRRFGPNARGFSAETFTEINLVIEIPEGLRLDVKTRFGEVTVDGRFGDIDVNLRAGEIDLRTPRSDVRELRVSCRIGEVSTNLGDEIVEKAGMFMGQTRFLNPDGKSLVTVHATAGEVNVTLTK